MPKRPQSIAREALREVAAGSMHSTPLGSLSFFITANSDPTRSVSKSFDVLTLSSPITSVARVAHDQGRVLPRLPNLPPRTRPPAIMGTPPPTSRRRRA